MNKGFTLAELLLAVAILAFALCGILATLITCFDLITIAKNLTNAINAAEDKIEEIRDYAFYKISTDYHLQTFTVDEIAPGNSRGIIYIDDANPDLLKVTISVCWRQSGNRIIGEDLNLNGILNPGEDSNGNNMIDSPAQIVTLITAR